MIDVSCAAAPPRLHRSAVFDASGRYRYALSRRWDPNLPAVTFVMLNPSTADAARDDPTIRRCLAFARAWGYGALEVVNLFAYRTPHPSILRDTPDPVGPDNDVYLAAAARRADLMVVAWGCHGTLHGRDRAVWELLGEVVSVYCMGTTRCGQPRHPLYLSRDTRPVPWMS